MNGINKILQSKGFFVFVTFLGLYLISSGTSWAIFSYLKDEPGSSLTTSEIQDVRSKIASLPKTEECPINGQFFSEIERDIWLTRRPITAVIENHADSRPVEGIHKADIVYEGVAEGGITRYLGIFYCDVSSEDFRLAPIRSARIYFLSWAAEYGKNPLFVHVGGANNICGTCPGGVKFKGQVAPEVRAIEKLVDLGWRVPRGNDFDTTYDSGFPVLFRDTERLGKPIAMEHTMIATTDGLFKHGIDRGYGYEDSSGDAWIDSFTPWKFVDESKASTPSATEISFEFWSNKPDYNVKWTYDSASNSYLRENGGTAHKDLKSGEQISTKNIIIQFVEEKGPVDEEKHMFYKTVDSGKGYAFMNGLSQEITWEKESFTGRTIFTGEDGKELELVRGKVWVEALPEGNEVIF